MKKAIGKERYSWKDKCIWNSSRWCIKYLNETLQCPLSKSFVTGRNLFIQGLHSQEQDDCKRTVYLLYPPSTSCISVNHLSIWHCFDYVALVILFPTACVIALIILQWLSSLIFQFLIIPRIEFIQSLCEGKEVGKKKKKIVAKHHSPKTVHVHVC